jgi:protein SPA2
MEGLFVELDNLNRRNDELMTAKDSDLAVIRDLDVQLKEYKRKYEQAKTELRSVKGELLLRTHFSRDFDSLFSSNFSTIPTCPETRQAR